MDEKKKIKKEEEISSADKDFYDITINDRELDEDYAKEMEEEITKILKQNK